MTLRAAAVARLCCGAQPRLELAGGRATTWKNIAEWYSPHNWVHWAR